MGNLPWNSGMRSEGLATWNAPEAIKSMWSVLTMPYFVFTVEPSTMGRRSLWTPSLETSGLVPDCRPAILSISSMKTMPDCSTLSTASLWTFSMSMRRWVSSWMSISYASGTRTFRFLVFLGKMLENMSLRFMSISSTPWEESISMDGIFCCSVVSTSMVLSSSLPSLKRALSFSLVDF